jgi:Uma2 family endonuclease
MASVSIAERKISVTEFLEMNLEEGYIYELINGVIMRRTSPNLDHQDVVVNLTSILNVLVKSKNLGKIYVAPTDVYITEFNLVVPDLVFIAKSNLGILQEKRCIVGVPDLIIEVLSKGTQKIDKGDKLKLYKKYGVKEYWMINPRSQGVEVYEWQNGDYELMFSAEETGEITSQVLDGFKIDISEFFQ